MIGGITGVAGLVFIGFGTAGVGTVRNTAVALVATDPGCKAGIGISACLKEAHEGSTALGFDSHGCDHITGRDSTLDYFVFVIPGSHTSFTGTPAVVFDTGPANGVIDSNPKFFAASAPAGAVLEEASSTVNGGTVFNLTHTCPASVTSSSSSSSSTTTSSKSTTSKSTSSTSSTTPSTTTSTTTSNTGSVSGSSTTSTSSTTPSTTTSSTTNSSTTNTGSVSGSSTTSTTSTTSSTTPTTTTTSSTNSSTSPTTSTTSSTTGTGSVSGTTTTSTTSPTTTTTASTGSGSISITTTTSGGGGGVQGIAVANTGADTQFGAGLALLILGGGLTFGGSRVSRRKKRQ